MQEILHFAFGLFLLKFLQEPLLVFPAVFVGHFLLDAIPHYKFITKKRSTTLLLIAVDAFLCLLLAFSYFVYSAKESILIILATLFFSILPDFFLFINFFFKKQLCKSFMINFHKKIQHEYSWGWIIELTFLVILLFFVFK
jgi:hypothetical protein